MLISLDLASQVLVPLDGLFLSQSQLQQHVPFLHARDGPQERRMPRQIVSLLAIGGCLRNSLSLAQ
jgi:hypothetical protein